jgi:hypothetical protein
LNGFVATLKDLKRRSLLESSSILNQPITTDMETLTREVKSFATDKKLEIEMLQVRENTVGNSLGVSHELKPLFTVQGFMFPPHRRCNGGQDHS